MNELTEEERLRLLFTWEAHARTNQQAPPGDWTIWMLLAGRGFGKTRVGAEWVRARVDTGKYGRMALVAPTAADARDVMVEGESGILAISPTWNRPIYEPSKRRLTWTNGAIATTYSADEPDRLRGPQHDGAWCDELAAWKYPEAFDQLQFGLRLGNDPRAVVTTTPRPIPIIKELIKEKTTAVTRGSTHENAENLAPTFLSRIITKYEGTRLGRQELNAEILEDTEGALWKQKMIDENRVRQAPELVRIVVAIDPAVTSNKDSAETGIIAAGIGRNGHGYILDDISLQASPNEWASKAVEAYHRFQADRIIGESNNGGDLVEHTIRVVDNRVSYKKVYASRGKFTRAEPISALYEKGMVHHVGNFPKLEDQMTSWTPGEKSPDRLDALVWALTELMINKNEIPKFKMSEGFTKESAWKI